MVELQWFLFVSLLFLFLRTFLKGGLLAISTMGLMRKEDLSVFLVAVLLEGAMDWKEAR